MIGKEKEIHADARSVPEVNKNMIWYGVREHPSGIKTVVSLHDKYSL